MGQIKIVVVALSLVVAFGAVSALVFRREEQGGDSDFDEDARAWAQDWLSEYTFPQIGALSTVDDRCHATPVPLDDVGCGQYVEAVVDLDPKLTDIISRANDLLATAPPDADPELLESLRDALSSAEAAHQKNLLLVEAWRTQDAGKWEQAWRSLRSPTPTLRP